MALTKVGKEGITGISNSSDATAITIDSSEKVGIGQGTPDAELHIGDGGGSSDNTRLRLTGGTSGQSTIQFGDTDSANIGQLQYDHSSNFLAVRVNASERMRIDSGDILIGKTSTAASTDGIRLTATPGNASNFSINAGTPLQINRNGDDGGLINFLQAGSLEGGISVSGSTVSYTGGHLSRWSQATDGNRIDGLVKGTVMTNLDQMAEWTKDGVTEDNEQLNCMAVSSVEGDVNVSGVFVNWDDDDEDYTADMNVAMTGDMVIRIAQGTTVARGDLLMSAGDGTAKPQGDGYVQDKTIAKVTSTTKAHTYDDGTYLVPCVLMAC